jgi:hypothetical protein
MPVNAALSSNAIILLAICGLVALTWVAILVWAALFALARRYRAVCLACFRWDFSRQRPQKCKFCGLEKSTTRDSLRERHMALPPTHRRLFKR